MTPEVSACHLSGSFWLSGANTTRGIIRNFYRLTYCHTFPADVFPQKAMGKPPSSGCTRRWRFCIRESNMIKPLE
jgi:hypothetical protein